MDVREPWLETDLVHKYSRHASSCFVLALCFKGEGGKEGGGEGEGGRRGRGDGEGEGERGRGFSLEKFWE